jgi:hypothetical protein
MWLSFSCILEFPLFPPSLHNTCSCYYLHSQIDADKDSVFRLVNLHPSSIQVERKIGCISIPSKSVQVFWFKFLVWYARSKNLNSRNLNGDMDAKLVSCIPGFNIGQKFEDTKGVIRIRISKKNRQHNGQNKKYKRTSNDLQNIHIKLKIE